MEKLILNGEASLPCGSWRQKEGDSDDTGPSFHTSRVTAPSSGGCAHYSHLRAPVTSAALQVALRSLISGHKGGAS